MPYASKVVAVVGFQFHKGTIRTYFCEYGKEKLHLFQFHKGTIRTKLNFIFFSLYHISIP